MALSTAGRNAAANAIAALATHLSLHTGDPGSSGTAEVTGGSPAYARKAVTWNTASGGVADTSNAPVFDVPGSTSVSHFGLWTAASGGTFLGGDALSATEGFAAQGTYTATDATITVT